MKKKLFLLLLCSLFFPVLGFADSRPKDQWVFHINTEAEHIRIHLAMLELDGDAASLAVYYTVPVAALQAYPGQLEDIAFYLMPDAESLELPQEAAEGERYGPSEVFTLQDSQRFEGESYSYRIRWNAAEAWPDVLYVRPYYRSLEAWGDVLELWLVDGAHQQFIQSLPSEGNG